MSLTPQHLIKRLLPLVGILIFSGSSFADRCPKELEFEFSTFNTVSGASQWADSLPRVLVTPRNEHDQMTKRLGVYYVCLAPMIPDNRSYLVSVYAEITDQRGKWGHNSLVGYVEARRMHAQR